MNVFVKSDNAPQIKTTKSLMSENGELLEQQFLATFENIKRVLLRERVYEPVKPLNY